MNQSTSFEDQQINNGNFFPNTSSRQRLISKEGHINIRRLNIEDRSRYLKDLYTTLLDLRWIWLLLLFVICLLISWIVFAVLWYILMIINGDFNTNNVEKKCLIGIKSFRGVLLYSIETQQTIGYGTRSLNEECQIGILILIVQTCFGLIIQSLALGIIYTKLSRPRKRRRTIIWSKQAVITIRDGYLTFQCRLADMRDKSTLVEAHIRMFFIQNRLTKENEFVPNDLIDMDLGFSSGKDRILLNWPITIEHKIDLTSPLFHIDKNQISKESFEILVVLEGIIESTGMITQIKTSYTPQEILWGAKFQTMNHFDQQSFFIDYSKFNSVLKENLTSDCSAKQLQAEREQNNTN